MVLSSPPSSSNSLRGSPVDHTTTACARLFQCPFARRGGDETEGSRTATAAASAPNPSPSTSNAADHIVATTAVRPRGTSRSVHAPGGLLFLGGGLRHSAAHREPFLPPLPPNVVEIYLATRGRRPPGPHEARAVAAWAFCGLCRLAYTLPSLETRETAAQAFCALCLGAYSSPSLEARETAAQAFCSLGRGAYSPPLPSRDAIDGGAGIPRHVPWSVLPPRPSRGVIDGGAGVLWPGARGVLPPSLSGCGRWRRRRSAAWSVGRTIPRPSWGPGDGGAGDVRPEPRGVLPPFPLAVQSTAAQAICSLNRGRTPPLTFIGCGRWRRGFYSRGRGAYSPPFPSGCGRRWRGQSAACRPNPSRPGRCSTPSLGSGRARGDVRDEE